MADKHLTTSQLWNLARPVLDSWDSSEEDLATAAEQQNRVFFGEIESIADAVAKLDAALHSLDDGQRADELDHVAIRKVIRWLCHGGMSEHLPATPVETAADDSAAAPASGLRQITDDDLREWERQRKGWLDASKGLGHDDDEIGDRIDISDEYDRLIIAAPCKSEFAVELKIEALKRAIKEGARRDHMALLLRAADQVAFWACGKEPPGGA